MLEKKRAVIFDLDGTLVDSMWMWGDIDREFLGQRNLELPETLQKEIEGMSFTETAAHFKKLFDLPESIEELKTIWNEMAMEKYQNQVPPKLAALSFLQYLKEQDIRIGIATSNSRELVDAVTNALGLNSYLDCIVTGCEVERGKPSPDIYLKAAELLHTDPADCLVFEDIPMGILAGKNAGMQVCAVWDAYSQDQEQEKKRLADYYIQSYNDIFERTYEVLRNE